MPDVSPGRNIEIKARDPDPVKTRALAEKFSDTPTVVLEQHDAFFACPNGRLKLRQFSTAEAQLIYYRRADLPGTKQSDYLIAPVPFPEKMSEVLAAALGARQTVTKRRLLFQVGQTRVHLDAVVDLGSFVELEVVLRDGQQAEEGHCIARELMAKLELRDEDLIDCAYADLLAARQNNSRIPVNQTSS